MAVRENRLPNEVNFINTKLYSKSADITNYIKNSQVDNNYQIATKIDLLVSKFLRLKEQASGNYSNWEKNYEIVAENIYEAK